MAHAFANFLTHVIFSARNREHLITGELKPVLLACMGGIVRELEGKAVAINSMPGHVHMLLWLPPSVAAAEALRILITNSCRWVRQTRPRLRGFAWQTGYAAFSVSKSNAASVAKYIRHQEMHHRRMTFPEELVSFLKRNGVQCDERYIRE
ncbi:MAG TPA: IS200/IS605 family transposase [Terriglobia bacterium]|nr:IS200/IS605 family transposase [Terriglobia bacterium]